MASYPPGSLFSLPPAVTLEAVMKGCHRYRKDGTKAVGIGHADTTGAAPDTACTSLQKSAPPSTIYWQLKQCLQCGIPFNDHLCDRLAPLSPALQAVPRIPHHFPAPPARTPRNKVMSVVRTTTAHTSPSRSRPGSLPDRRSPHATFLEEGGGALVGSVGRSRRPSRRKGVGVDDNDPHEQTEEKRKKKTKKRVPNHPHPWHAP